MKTMTKILGISTALCLTGAGTFAQTKWDLSTARGASNCHAESAIAFADAVREATDGSEHISVHLSGETGVEITEKLAAVETGIVSMADMLLFLQAGEEPFLGVDTLPNLIQGQDEMTSD